MRTHAVGSSPLIERYVVPAEVYGEAVNARRPRAHPRGGRCVPTLKQ